MAAAAGTEVEKVAEGAINSMRVAEGTEVRQAERVGTGVPNTVAAEIEMLSTDSASAVDCTVG